MIIVKRIMPAFWVCFLSIWFAGCSSEGDSRDVRLLGFAPVKAWLGVEYYYNYGGEGGQVPLDYSLSNNPSWLSIEKDNNLARQGVVLRGVPGVTGGNNGAGDLGSNKGVVLMATDGKDSDTYSFDLKVWENELTLSPASVREGEIDDNGAKKNQDSPDALASCAIPDLDVRKFRVDDDYITAYPVLVKVELGQASVQTTRVKYRLSSNYREDFEETDEVNRKLARPNRDFFIDYDSGTGEKTAFQKGLYPMPGDSFVPGVVTFPPGARLCYIRVYINEDKVGESDESFSVALTEVIQGLASIGPAKRANVAILDNEPVASFRDANVVIQNEGTEALYTIELDKPPGRVFDHFDDQGEPVFVDNVIRVKVRLQEKNDGRNNRVTAEMSDFVLAPSLDDTPGTDVTPGTYVTFTGDQTEATFSIRLPDDGDKESGPDEKVILHLVDEPGASGAVALTERKLILRINEWPQDLSVGSGASMVKSITTDRQGNVMLLVVEPSESGQSGKIRVYNRFGELTREYLAVSGTSVIPVGIVFDAVFNSEQDEKDETDDYINQLTAAFNVASDQEGSRHDIVTLRYSKLHDFAEYSSGWRYQFGSAGDDRATVMMVRGASIYFAGDTDGDWQDVTLPSGADRSNLENKGNGDVFVASLIDQNDSRYLKWVVLEGSEQEDKAMDMSYLGQINVLGSTKGQVGSKAFGGTDGFIGQVEYWSGQKRKVIQIGSPDNDRFSFLHFNLGYWIGGSSTREIRMETRDDDKKQYGVDEVGPIYEAPRAQTLFLDNKLEEPKTVVWGLDGQSGLATGIKLDSATNLLSGSTSGRIAESAVNLGGKDAFILAYGVKEPEDGKLETRWARQFGTVADDEVIDLHLHDGYKLFYLWKSDQAGYTLGAMDKKGEFLGYP